MRKACIHLTGVACAAAAGLAASRAALAQEFPETRPAPTRQVATQPAPDTRRGQFDKGTRTFEVYGGYFNDLGPYDVEGGFTSVGTSYYFADGFSLGAEVSGYGISQPVNNAAAGAAGVVFRHQVLDGGNSSLFFDVAASAFWATDDVPASGTQWNYVTQAGVGATQRLSDDSLLMLGVRFFHLSNADLHGDDKNPALNGISVYVGLMFKL
jgi:hypothetical protein